MAAFDEALAIVLRHEGGFVFDPHDNGGATRLGVTKRTWEAYTGKPASIADIKALTVAKVKPLYKSRYWDAVCGDQLPPALAYVLFDFGVNAGPARAVKMLQRIIGVGVDGDIGPRTLKAVRDFVAAHGLPELVRQFQNARRDYYRALDDFPHFGRGWLRRCDEGETQALKMCK